MNYGEPESKELPIHEQVRQSRVALCGMAPLITDEVTERWAEAVRLSSQSDYDRLLGSYHAAERLAHELKAALDAARKEVTDLATRCADLENESDAWERSYRNVRAELHAMRGTGACLSELDAPQPEPGQRQDAIPAPAAQQGRPVSVEPAPASSMPFNALAHAPKATPR